MDMKDINVENDFVYEERAAFLALEDAVQDNSDILIETFVWNSQTTNGASKSRNRLTDVGLRDFITARVVFWCIFRL